jgi:phage FluMu gp28-like protein
LILYGNCNKQYATQPRFEVLDNLEKDNLIEQDKFNTLLESSLLRLPTDKKTRKKVEKIIKIKTNTNANANNSRNKSKKKKGSIGKNKKSKKKRR